MLLGVAGSERGERRPLHGTPRRRRAGQQQIKAGSQTAHSPLTQRDRACAAAKTSASLGWLPSPAGG
jgi:hypothetical protein